METIYSYDAYNRLVEVKNTSTTIRFNYDALGRRIEKTVEDSTGNKEIFHYIYDGNNLIAMADKNNNLIANWTYGVGIDEPLVMTKYDNNGSAVNYFYHSDHLGSIIYITNESGEIIESYEYKVYGEPTIKNNKGEIIQESILGNPFMFTGREYDNETGLYFYRARYYDPEIGRFIQEDPIGFSGGDTNLYAYVRNNPVYYKDPSGTEISGCNQNCVEKCLEDNYGSLADLSYKASIFSIFEPTTMKLILGSAGIKFGLLGGTGIMSYYAESYYAQKGIDILSKPISSYGIFGLETRGLLASKAFELSNFFGSAGNILFKGAYSFGVLGTAITVGSSGFYYTAKQICKSKCRR